MLKTNTQEWKRSKLKMKIKLAFFSKGFSNDSWFKITFKCTNQLFIVSNWDIVQQNDKQLQCVAKAAPSRVHL